MYRSIVQHDMVPRQAGLLSHVALSVAKLKSQSSSSEKRLVLVGRAGICRVNRSADLHRKGALKSTELVKGAKLV